MNGFCQVIENQEEYIAGQDQIWQKKLTTASKSRKLHQWDQGTCSRDQNLTDLGSVEKV
jgi:hypothetical protein